MPPLGPIKRKDLIYYLRRLGDERLIHRDVKPENTLLGPNNEVWLSDFGIASVVHSTRSLNTEQSGGNRSLHGPGTNSG